MAVAMYQPTEGALLLTREDYHLLSCAGRLDKYKKTELIEGRIVVSAKGRRHVLAKRRLRDYLQAACAGQSLYVESEDPIAVDDYNEPEPDVAVLRGRPEDYVVTPRAGAVLLIAEVAFSTLARDREEKWRAYGRAGIPEYWIVNLQENRVEMWTDPRPEGGYGHDEYAAPGDWVMPSHHALAAAPRLEVAHVLAPEASGEES